MLASLAGMKVTRNVEMSGFSWWVLQGDDWHLVAFLLVKALALHHVPALHTASEASRVFRGSHLHLTVEEVDELYALLVPA